MKTALYAALALALTALPAAAERPTRASQSVNIAGLDLSKPDQAETALDRIERVAHEVCVGDAPTPTNLRARRAVEACQKDAIANAVAKLNAAEVSRLYAMSRAGVARQSNAALR